MPTTDLRLQTETVTSQDAELWSEDDQTLQEAGVNTNEDVRQNCCIGCYRLMPPEVPPEGQLDDGESQGSEPELLCASCISSLASKDATTHGSALSPLPKLSLLVKAEAKCQDQLQLLQRQQELLQQQRQSMEATRRAKDEAAAAERELARQRRKHFLMIQERRKREEELKFQQFQAEQSTSRSEQETNRSADKPKKKRSKPKVDVSLLRKSEPPPEIDAASLPQVVEPTLKRTETPQVRITDTAEARRKQMMECYSQDLSPLVNGGKPKRLPVPKPLQVPACIVKRRQPPDNNAQTAVSTSSFRGKCQRKASKKTAPKNMKLRPLDEHASGRQKSHVQYESNQFEGEDTRKMSEAIGKRFVASPLSLQVPRRTTDNSAPLTAEIKPMSWAYELAKDVLQQENAYDYADEAGIVSFSTPLHTVTEEDTPQFTMFPLQHQLPNPTFPPSKTLSEPPTDASSPAPRWEYSSERLTNLLEKYNVSVSAVTAGAAAPKL
ncbi:hypothetical protein PHYBOEH_010900 [Phytophthora boehmeriae]|uniref:Uncharacterized protein n=1 Tax=Phytophthora boehmeriae TaxID=109152 RepID=A0A8T1WYK6_9STRA|nr:hypothetical protein PHYBOEH_010900 [Phytophthora boehmeriae]